MSSATAQVVPIKSPGKSISIFTENAIWSWYKKAILTQNVTTSFSVAKW